MSIPALRKLVMASRTDIIRYARSHCASCSNNGLLRKREYEIFHTQTAWGGEWGGSSKNNLAKEFGKDTVLSLIFTLQIASDYH